MSHIAIQEPLLPSHATAKGTIPSLPLDQEPLFFSTLLSMSCNAHGSSPGAGKEKLVQFSKQERPYPAVGSSHLCHGKEKCQGRLTYGQSETEKHRGQQNDLFDRFPCPSKLTSLKAFDI
ncbi:hypothetical protein DUI87_31585 [Hirundo rustica rustica]|uniref:Uncharacterized protein n=1 Tax=Hirundo rustica rustica TaxID=333673 RepID=A0A3M0JBM1_HIRRU|nr:hypothetical protein DUI87_31585 [Hirundo rustica rustica]